MQTSVVYEQERLCYELWTADLKSGSSEKERFHLEIL